MQACFSTNKKKCWAQNESSHKIKTTLPDLLLISLFCFFTGTENN